MPDDGKVLLDESLEDGISKALTEDRLTHCLKALMDGAVPCCTIYSVEHALKCMVVAPHASRLNHLNCPQSRTQLCTCTPLT